MTPLWTDDELPMKTSSEVSQRDMVEETLEPTVPETPLSKWRMGSDEA